MTIENIAETDDVSFIYLGLSEQDHLSTVYRVLSSVLNGEPKICNFQLHILVSTQRSLPI